MRQGFAVTRKAPSIPLEICAPPLQITVSPSPGRPVVGDLFANFDFNQLPNTVNTPTYNRLCAFLRNDLELPELVPPCASVRDVGEAIKKFNTSKTLCWVVAREMSGGGTGAQDDGLGDFGSTQRIFAHCAEPVLERVEMAAARMTPTAATSTATTQLQGSAAAVGADVVHDLGRWLQAVKLSDFEPALRKLGAEDAHDVRDGFAAGAITKEVLEAEGLKTLRIIRLQREAGKVSSRIVCKMKRE
jgi:hypothetical protein